MLWVLLEHGDIDPLGLFVANYRRNPKKIATSFKSETGHSLSFRSPRNDKDRIVRAKFWEYVRMQLDHVLSIKAIEIRKRMQGMLISNVHFDTPVQYGEWGQIFDIPCVGIRPAIVNDPDVWRYWVGYATRLVADATQKLPVVSIRFNLAAVGARKIPTKSTITYWHSQAIQNGARGFDFWMLDFLADRRDPRSYIGPINGNPDQSTIPKDRWNAMLEICRNLSGRKAFNPPRSDLAIFVNLFGSSPQHWQRLFQAYCVLASRKIFSNFVTDENLVYNRVKLAKFKVLIVPELTAVRVAVLNSLQRFVEEGGTILMAAFREVLPDRNAQSEFMGILSARKKLERRPRNVLLRNKKLVLRQRNLCYHRTFGTLPK
jgi:hypothetical protein